MARVGGRSAWIAWPAGMVCAAVVVALFWLAVPGVPVVVQFVGNVLRVATTEPVAREADPADTAPATDCRSLYPDDLWADLVWTPDVLLGQSASAPSATSTLTATLAPHVRFTCVWRAYGDRTISSTLAEVPGDAAGVAGATLPGEGFACTPSGDGVACTRSAAGVTEIHELHGALWLSSVLTNWEPAEYGPLTASRAFAP